MKTTKLSLKDQLPLTCSRTGTCCHGKMVWINPWELANLAHAKEVSPKEFRDVYCEFGGIRLAFNGKKGWREQSACSQYIEDFGCAIHTGRPLACRLFPLGLHREGEQRYYMYHGEEFPCMDGCPEVVDLPSHSVEEYVSGQETKRYEAGQDAYLELMENLADGAFALLIDSGLADTGDRETLRLWRKMGAEKPQKLSKRIGEEWLSRLMLPQITDSLDTPKEFARLHYNLLQVESQKAFGTLETIEEFRNASVLMMSLALHLGRGLGANPQDLSEHWIATAKEHGVLE